MPQNNQDFSQQASKIQKVFNIMSKALSFLKDEDNHEIIKNFYTTITEYLNFERLEAEELFKSISSISREQAEFRNNFGISPNPNEQNHDSIRGDLKASRDKLIKKANLKVAGCSWWQLFKYDYLKDSHYHFMWIYVIVVGIYDKIHSTFEDRQVDEFIEAFTNLKEVVRIFKREINNFSKDFDEAFNFLQDCRQIENELEILMKRLKKRRVFSTLQTKSENIANDLEALLASPRKILSYNLKGFIDSHLQITIDSKEEATTYHQSRNKEHVDYIKGCYTFSNILLQLTLRDRPEDHANYYIRPSFRISRANFSDKVNLSAEIATDLKKLKEKQLGIQELVRRWNEKLGFANPQGDFGLKVESGLGYAEYINCTQGNDNEYGCTESLIRIWGNENNKKSEQVSSKINEFHALYAAYCFRLAAIQQLASLFRNYLAPQGGNNGQISIALIDDFRALYLNVAALCKDNVLELQDIHHQLEQFINEIAQDVNKSSKDVKEIKVDLVNRIECESPRFKKELGRNNGIYAKLKDLKESLERWQTEEHLRETRNQLAETSKFVCELYKTLRFRGDQFLEQSYEYFGLDPHEATRALDSDNIDNILRNNVNAYVANNQSPSKRYFCPQNTEHRNESLTKLPYPPDIDFKENIIKTLLGNYSSSYLEKGYPDTQQLIARDYLYKIYTTIKNHTDIEHLDNAESKLKGLVYYEDESWHLCSFDKWLCKNSYDVAKTLKNVQYILEQDYNDQPGFFSRGKSDNKYLNLSQPLRKIGLKYSKEADTLPNLALDKINNWTERPYKLFDCQYHNLSNHYQDLLEKPCPYSITVCLRLLTDEQIKNPEIDYLSNGEQITLKQEELMVCALDTIDSYYHQNNRQLQEVSTLDISKIESDFEENFKRKLRDKRITAQKRIDGYDDNNHDQPQQDHEPCVHQNAQQAVAYDNHDYVAHGDIDENNAAQVAEINVADAIKLDEIARGALNDYPN